MGMDIIINKVTDYEILDVPEVVTHLIDVVYTSIDEVYEAIEIALKNNPENKDEILEFKKDFNEVVKKFGENNICIDYSY